MHQVTTSLLVVSTLSPSCFPNLYMVQTGWGDLLVITQKLRGGQHFLGEKMRHFNTMWQKITLTISLEYRWHHAGFLYTTYKLLLSSKVDYPFTKPIRSGHL